MHYFFSLMVVIRKSFNDRIYIDEFCVTEFCSFSTFTLVIYFDRVFSSNGSCETFGLFDRLNQRFHFHLPRFPRRIPLETTRRMPAVFNFGHLISYRWVITEVQRSAAPAFSNFGLQFYRMDAITDHESNEIAGRNNCPRASGATLSA